MPVTERAAEYNKDRSTPERQQLKDNLLRSCQDLLNEWRRLRNSTARPERRCSITGNSAR